MLNSWNREHNYGGQTVCWESPVGVSVSSGRVGSGPRVVMEWWYYTTPMTFPMTLVLHHPNDFSNDLGTTPPQWLSQWPWYYNTPMTFPNDLCSTPPQWLSQWPWYYTTPMTFPMTLILTLTLIVDTITIDQRTFNHVTPQYPNDPTPSQWPWPLSLWPLTLTLNTITHHHHLPIHTNTHHMLQWKNKVV